MFKLSFLTIGLLAKRIKYCPCYYTKEQPILSLCGSQTECTLGRSFETHEVQDSEAENI